MTDYSADNLTPSNGPAPFAPAPRSEETPTPPGGSAPATSNPLGASSSPTTTGIPGGPGGPGGSSPPPGPFGRPGGGPGPGPGSDTPIGGGAPNGGAQRMAGAPEVKGRIEVADEVVEKVAALAAIEVPGVADLGGDIARALENVRERIGIGQKRGDQGIKARVTNREVSVDVTIVIEYGYVVMDVARQVKHNVASQTSRMLGLRVVEVNVTVDDVKLPEPERQPEPDDSGDLLPID